MTGRQRLDSSSPAFASCAPTPKTLQSPGAKASFAIRHTGGARAAIQEARAALKLSWRYIEAFEAEAAALYAASMDVDDLREFAAELVKVDQADTTVVRNRRRDQASAIVKLWVSSPLPTA